MEKGPMRNVNAADISPFHPDFGKPQEQLDSELEQSVRNMRSEIQTEGFEQPEAVPRRSLGENPNDVIATPQRAYAADRLALRGEQVVGGLKSKAKNGIGNMLKGLKSGASEMKNEFVEDVRFIKDGAVEAAYTGVGLAAETADKITSKVSKAPEMMKDTAKNLFGRGKEFIKQTAINAREKKLLRQEKRAENAKAREERIEARQSERTVQAEQPNEVQETQVSSKETIRVSAEQRELQMRKLESVNREMMAKQAEIRKLRAEREEAERRVQEAEEALRKNPKDEILQHKLQVEKADLDKADGLLKISGLEAKGVRDKQVELVSTIDNIESNVQEARDRLIQDKQNKLLRREQRKAARREAFGDRVDSAKDRLGKLVDDAPGKMAKIGRGLGRLARAAVGGIKGFAAGAREGYSGGREQAAEEPSVEVSDKKQSDYELIA